MKHNAAMAEKSLKKVHPEVAQNKKSFIFALIKRE